MSYLCSCGHVIKDNIYPCPEVGDLKWQPESESASQDACQALKEFLIAVENGAKNEWLKRFFDVGENKLVFEVIEADGERTTGEIGNDFYLGADMATIITDIMSRYEGREGHSVYRCPECERLYIQKQYESDEYECFEKRVDYLR